jgi:hypothetical protein
VAYGDCGEARSATAEAAEARKVRREYFAIGLWIPKTLPDRRWSSTLIYYARLRSEEDADESVSMTCIPDVAAKTPVHGPLCSSARCEPSDYPNVRVTTASLSARPSLIRYRPQLHHRRPNSRAILAPAPSPPRRHRPSSLRFSTRIRYFRLSPVRFWASSSSPPASPAGAFVHVANFQQILLPRVYFHSLFVSCPCVCVTFLRDPTDRLPVTS